MARVDRRIECRDVYTGGHGGRFAEITLEKRRTCGVVLRGRYDPTSAANGAPPEEAIVGLYQELGRRIYSHRVIEVGQDERPIASDSCGDVSHIRDGQKSVHHVGVNLVDNSLYGSKPAQAERGVRHSRKSGKRENRRAGFVEHA